MSDESCMSESSSIQSTVSDQASRAKIKMYKHENDKLRKALKKSEELTKKKDSILKEMSEKYDKITAARASGQVDMAQVDDIIAQAANKDQRIIELSEKIEENERRILDLQELVTEKDQVIWSRTEAIKLLQKSSGLSEDSLRSLISEKDVEVETLKDSLKLRQAEIEKREMDLKNIIERHEKVISELCTSQSIDLEGQVIKSLQSRVDDSYTLLNNKSLEIDQLRTIIRENDTKINTLQGEKSDLSDKIGELSLNYEQKIQKLNEEMENLNSQIQQVRFFKVCSTS